MALAQLQEGVLRIGTSALPYYTLPVTAAQTSTDAYVEVVGSAADLGPFDIAAITCVCATKAVTVKLQGANFSDFRDAADVAEQALAIGETKTLLPNTFGTVSQRYLRAVVKSTVAGQHGTVTAQGVVKRSLR